MLFPDTARVRRRTSVVLFFLLTLLTLTAHCARAETNTVKLGVNYPLTGPYSIEGLDQIRAAQLAVDEVNSQGGILGRRVELVRRDSGSDTLRTELNVHELIDEGCSMIFGGSSSAVAITTSRICQAHNIPFFGTLTYSTATTMEDGHRVSFRECSDSYMSAQVLGPWLKKHYPGKRYFFITADYTWGWTTERSVRLATGAVDRKKHPGLLFPLGATDFSQGLLKAAKEPPHVLVLVLFGKDMAYALRQASEMGLKDYCQIVVPNVTLGMAERAGSNAMEGVVGTLPWTWKIPELYDFQGGKRFVREFSRRYNRYPSTSGASAYTIVYEYKSAVERAQSFRTEDVVKALEGHTYQHLKGPQTWRALDHQSVQNVYLVRGNKPQKVLADPLRLDYFTILGDMAGKNAALTPEQWKNKRRAAGLPPFLERFPNEPEAPQSETQGGAQ